MEPPSLYKHLGTKLFKVLCEQRKKRNGSMQTKYLVKFSAGQKTVQCHVNITLMSVLVRELKALSKVCISIAISKSSKRFKNRTPNI